MRLMVPPLLVLLCAGFLWGGSSAETIHESSAPMYQVWPIGWVRKHDERTTIEIDPRYQPALLGLEAGASIWVLYWLDRNDTPEQRAILQVHPRGDPRNPVRGVFATHAPVRPNLIALSRCRVVAVYDNLIEVDGIDAFSDMPVLDIKPAPAD